MVSDKFTMPASPVGTIEALTSGFEIVATHLPLLLLPLLIDLCLWMGPRVTFQPLYVLADQVLEPIVQQGGTQAEQANAPLIAALKDNAASAPENYLPVSMLPSLLGGREAKSLPFGYTPQVIRSLPGAIAAIGLATLGGLVIWGFYVGLIASQVKDNWADLWHITRRLPLILIQLIIFIIFLIFVLFLLSFFMGLVFAMLALMGLDMASSNDLIAGIILVVMFLLVVPASVFLAFTVHGMFLNDRNFIAAMWDSMRVVQWNMSSTFGLFLLVLIISAAMRYIWELADPGSWLTLAAISGNAFITTGLLAATFIYFKDRYRYWREIREELLAELERRRAQQDNSRQT